MRPFHERLTQLGLEATERYGFVLAGGYAVSANGMGARLSEDVDLFTNLPDARDFADAVAALQDMYRRAGLEMEVVHRGETYLDMEVHDPRTGDRSDIQLGLDYREHAPARLEIGPVLDVKDAVANKMTALYSRGETRDFIDIDIVVQSGRFSREDVIALGNSREVEPMERAMLAARFREAAERPERQFERYGIDADQRARLVERFATWAEAIDPDPGPEGGTVETSLDD